MKEYDPKNWYWKVGGDNAKVFASARGVYVDISDAAYVAWLSEGNKPTLIDTAASLGEVLATALQRPVSPDVLDGYQEAQANNAVVKLLFKLIFQLKNDVLALQGKPAITAAQARAYVKAQM